MIGKLTGIIDSVDSDGVIIDVSGVGYLVACSGRTLGRLRVGAAASLVIETQMREEALHLFGFLDTAERDWFRLLTTVQGVGAKVALAILSILGPDQLVPAVMAGDRAALTQAPGVGPKLAARIANELKDKVDAMAPEAFAVVGGGEGAAPGAAADAISALANLGYRRTEALGAVSHATTDIGPDAGVEALVRAALARLAPREINA
jgi:Holliday junction DNA helicase RuvA